ncbi:MAG: OmpH family outer membrane protein [Syntrophobacterales bacterium]|nr:OmpH family outer membrane protein [Syntrophobacterales bacterium]
MKTEFNVHKTEFNVHKKYGCAIIAALLLALIFSAAPAAAADKTGFVDVREVMVSSAAGKKASEELKKAFEKSKEAIQARENELKKLKEELDKQKSLLKPDVLQEKEKNYDKKVRDYQLLVKDSNEELQGKEQDLQKKILPEILKIIRALGEKGKFTMIVDISQIPLPYFSKENLLTKQVIDEFDKTYKPKK